MNATETTDVLHLYAEWYPNRCHPDAWQVINIERRSRKNPLHHQRQRNKLRNNNGPRFLAVLSIVHLNPHVNTRQIERDLRIPRSTAHRMLQSIRYHITLVQEWNENDCRLTIEFCRWALDALEQDPDFFWNVCFSDEATFSSNGSLNRHNCHYWSSVNPH